MCFLERRKCDGEGGEVGNEEDKSSRNLGGWGGSGELGSVSQNTCWVQGRLVWLHLPACSSSWCSKTERKEGGDVIYVFSTLLSIFEHQHINVAFASTYPSQTSDTVQLFFLHHLNSS